jgi:putative PIN family toxin of toxin-antitoxin system
MESHDKLRVVIDTNVVLNALSPRLPYREVLKRAFKGDYEWCVTTEILLEYEEKITEFFGKDTAITFLEALTMSSFVVKAEVYYRFNFLPDMDDNKFIDCAFASNAHFIISDDKVFNNLENVPFPKIHRMQLIEFNDFLKANKE